MIRLLAFDLDGTTLTEHQFLSENNRKTLEQAAEQGVILVPASGRMKTFLPESITSLPGVRWAITANGAGVYDLQTGENVWQSLIDNEKAQQVQNLLDEYDVYVEYYWDGEAATKFGYPELAKTHFGLPKSKWPFIDKNYRFTEDFHILLKETGFCPEKINLPYLSSPELHREIWERVESLGKLRLTSSIPDNIEINDENAHKGAALAALCRRLSIAPDEVMAVGDNGNDVTMLEFAGCSVAVADGAPTALAAAKYRTADHDCDGLAQAIKQYVFRTM